jgi:hypothetical protein
MNKQMYAEILSLHGCNEKETSERIGMKQLVSSA